MIRRMLVAVSAAVLTLGPVPAASAAPPTVPTQAGDVARGSGGGATLKLAPDGRPATYVVRLEDPAVAAYAGGIDGLAATSPQDGGRIDIQSAPVQAYEDYLLTRQAEVTSAAETAIGRSPEVEFRYTQALNGFATRLTADEARAIAGLPGVAAVTVDEILRLQTDVGPEWIGAPALWGEATTVPPEIDGSLYVPAAPERVLDEVSLRSGRLHVLDLDDVTSVPAGATAVVLTVQVTDARGTPSVAICPAGTPATVCDDTSGLTAEDEGTTGQVVVALGQGADDAIANAVGLVSTGGRADVSADLAGWFVAADATDDGLLLQPTAATGVLDAERLPAGELVTIDLDDVGTVPAGARAVALTLTGEAGRRGTDVAACTGGTSVEDCTTTVLHLERNRTTASSTILSLSPDNTVSFVGDRAGVRLSGDVQGWFVDVAAGGSAFRPTAPDRVLAGARLGRDDTVTLDLDDVVDVPDGTTAVALTVTATDSSRRTAVSVCAGDTDASACADTPILDLRSGEDRANTVIVAVDPDTHALQLHNESGRVRLSADLAGFFTVVPGGEVVTSGTQGEGIVVGVIDTGIVPENPSFADSVALADGGDGYDHSNPFGAGRYVGVCDPGSAVFTEGFPCNDKLIGAWDFTGDQADGGASPRDDDGHGSHTASTSAGNRVRVTTESLEEPPFTATEVIKGVAPHANLIAYDVCGIPLPPAGPGPLDPGCATSSVVAAVNQAISDGVDVLNHSIGGGSSDPWADPDSLAFLAARTAGIFVATSAGNDGPGAETVGSPGEAPWITSVGATTHDRQWQNTLTDITAADGATLPDIRGLGFSSGTDGTFPLVDADAAPYENNLCLEDEFPAGTSFEGQIVICNRGGPGRVIAGEVVAALGAEGMVLANDPDNGNSLNADPHALPAVHISFDDGVALRAFLAANEGVEAAIAGATRVQDDALADRMAGFSSRGPNLTSQSLVPSLSAPGVDILAARGTGDSVEWGFISGTSMSSPHIAGAAALMTSLHPEWTPAEIESALMTTAFTDVTDTDGTRADWFDMGSGRVDLTKAGNAGLVLDEIRTRYLAADPFIGGDTTTLNLASMVSSACVVTCTWQRTVRGTDTGVGTWSVEGASLTDGIEVTVEPATFTFDRPDQTQVLTVTADVAGADLDAYAFGQVVLTPQDGSAAPVAHLPIAAFSSTAQLQDELVVTASEETGTASTATIRSAFDVTDLQAEVTGLTLGTETALSIPRDPTNDDPFNGDGVRTTLVTVPEGAERFVATLVDPTAPDFDLYVGTGTTPDADTLVCISGSSGSDEECDFTPDPEDGTQYWVLVQNWQASASGTDTVTLVTAVPVEDEGNLTVGEPTPAEPVEAGTEFTVPLTWDGLSEPGLWFGTVTLGTSAEDPDDIGTFFVTVDRRPPG